MGPDRSALERALVAQLAALAPDRGGWRPFRRRTRRPVDAARAIDGWPAAAPTVASFAARAAADPRWGVGPAATLALRHGARDPRATEPLVTLLAALPAPRLGQLEAWRDAFFCGTPAIGTRPAAEALLAPLRAAPRLVALHTLHRSGHVREAALEALPIGAEALPFALGRLADHVREVRAAAARAVERHLSPLHARALLAAYPELRRAERRRHFEHRALAEQVVRLLQGQARTGLFLERLDDPDREARRTAYRFAFETEGAATLGDLALRAAATHDGLLVEAALRALARLEDADERAAVAARLARSRCAATRRAVARAAPALAADPRALVAPLLVDRVASVRSAARFVDGRDPAALVAHLRPLAASDSAQGVGATLALAELGDRSRLPAVRAWLAHPSRRRRRSALAALRSTLGAEAAPELWALLARPDLARDAARALRAVGAPLDAAGVLALASAPHFEQRRAALLLAEGLPRVDELEVLLRLRAEPDGPQAGRLGARVDDALEGWLRHTNGMRLAVDGARRRDLLARLAGPLSFPAPLTEELRARLLDMP